LGFFQLSREKKKATETNNKQGALKTEFAKAKAVYR
jgi:hypothetical protein